MNKSAVAQEVAISIAMQANIPTLIWGGPGVGKTSFVVQLAKKLGIHIEVVLASIREPSDFGGLPYRDGDRVRLSPPNWAQRLAEVGNGILFLDEITCTSPATQSALLRVILDRVVGDLQLPPGIAIIAAANPPEIAAGGWELALPLLNRFFHVDWEIDVAHWCKGIVEGFNVNDVATLPANWRENIPFYRGKVASFIQRRPAELSKIPSERTANVRAYPTPRSWEMAATLCAAAKSVNAEIITFLSGSIGTGTAVEFQTHVGHATLSDPEALLKDPTSYEHIASTDARNAVLEGVITLALKDGKKATIKNAVLVLFHATAKAKSPGQFGGLVKKLADASPVNLISLIDDPQMRDYFRGHFQLKD